jgi:hypothetical protein
MDGDSAEARWDAYERSKRYGYPGLRDPTLLPPSCPVVRVRREYNARDAINSRAWDFFHATPPTQVSSHNLERSPPAYMDMNPIASRTNTVHYRNQPEYIPNPERGPATADSLGVAPPPGPITPPAKMMSKNPYMQRLDAEGEGSRNIVREMKAAVYEDNRELATDTDRSLTQRQFQDRWLPPKAAADIQSLQAYELLRPKQDDWRHK